MIAFFTLMLKRLLPALDGAVPSAATKSYTVSCWEVGALALLGSVFATAVRAIPPFGIPADVIGAQGFTTGGLWSEQSYRPLFMGTLSFATVGVRETVRRAVARRAHRYVDA